jgi:hypothetical protein
MKENFEPALTIEIPEDRESVKSVDVAEYFKSTSFEKKARSIDEDPNHPWDQARNRIFIIENETESFATGYGFDPETKMENILATYKKEDGSTSTVLVEGVESEDTRVLEYVQDFIPCLPDELRGDFIEKIMITLPDFKDYPNPSQKFVDIFLESIPNTQGFLDDMDTIELEKSLIEKFKAEFHEKLGYYPIVVTDKAFDKEALEELPEQIKANLIALIRSMSEDL